MKKKILSFLLATVTVMTLLITPLSTITASAASYPAVYHASTGMQIYCGDTVPLLFNYFPAYNNERITINIYSPDGTLVANCDFDVNNKYSPYSSLTTLWDTTDYAPGKYDIEIIKEFYSYFSWRTAPTNGSSFVTLVEPDSSMSLDNPYTGSDTHFEVRNDTSVAVTNKGIEYAYNAWQKLEVTDVSIPYAIQMTEMYLGDAAEEIAISENRYNFRGNSSCMWVLTKFEITNNGSSSLEASDTLNWASTYLPTGQKATFIDTCTFGDLPNYSTVIEAGETKEVWFGFYVLENQGIPFLKLENGAYISTHPDCSSGHGFSNNCDTICDVCHAIRKASAHKYTNNADTSCNYCGTYAYPGGNTLVKENGVWYHVVNRAKVKDTTLVKYNGVWYYIKGGVLNKSNTLVKFNGKWYHVNGGKWVKDTTLVKYGSTWHYVKGGVLNSANTLVKFNGKWYHVNGGKWVKDTTLVKYNGTWYYVKGGVLNSANTLVKFNGKWYHVNGGKWVKDTTLVKYGNKWYYVKKGVVDFTKNGKVYYNGKYYTVKKGVKI